MQNVFQRGKTMNMETKTDSELIELAAKAVGKKGHWVTKRILNKEYQYFVIKNADSCITEDWNPLLDDGQLHRLARALKVNIDFSIKSAFVFDKDFNVISEGWWDDKDEAYAILRLAARIGESK